MIKAILFDLDNVLVDTDKLHFGALNDALEACGEVPLSWQEHITIYRALPTVRKLEIMAERRGLRPELFHTILDYKSATTARMVDRFCEPIAEKIEMLRLLRARGYRVAVCSNAIRASVEQMLTRARLLDGVDFFLSNQDVERAKPSPEMYEMALDRLRIEPGEALVVEDSEAGLAAARAAGTHVMSVANPTEVNFYRVMLSVRAAERLTLVVPAAGDGKRFAEVGYVYPKPLIDVEGRPMLCHAVDDFLSLDPRIVTIMQREHVREFAAREVLDQHYPGIEMVEVERKTEGAACTVLLAEPYLNWDAELVLANSDQTVDVDLAEFVDGMRARRADAGILTFRDTNPKWSFARTDATGRVLEVAEKRPISDQATVGIYYFRRAGDFIRGARQMIAKDVRVNGEFYVCPVFNELIAAGLSVFVHQIERSAMNGLGTPEDLRAYLDRPRAVRQLRRAA